MFFHPKNMKSENNNPWFKLWFDILLHTQSIVCATVDSQCLEYLRYITLRRTKDITKCILLSHNTDMMIRKWVNQVIVGANSCSTTWVMVDGVLINASNGMDSRGHSATTWTKFCLILTIYPHQVNNCGNFT